MIVPLEIRGHDGGVNRRDAEDRVPIGQVVMAQNGRTGLYGSVEKRGSTKRIHSVALGSGSPVMGVVQWDPADADTEGSQIVAVSNGKLYHKRVSDSEFTEKAMGATATAIPSFVVSRHEGEQMLYIICDGKMWRFDGGDSSTPFHITAIPARFNVGSNYHGRTFAAWGRFLYWSAINQPEAWDVYSGGSVARIETFDMEDLIGLIVVAGALLLYKANTISRFAGYDISDIDIDTETEGLSPDTGLAAVNTLIRVEDVAQFLSDRGPYLATAEAIRPIGDMVEFLWDDIDKSLIEESVAYHNRRRRESCLVVPIVQEDGTTRWEGWRYNYRTHTWWGPDVWPFRIRSATRYERSDGSESVILGCQDGFVRDADVVLASGLHRDDVLAAGTGGTPIPLSVRYPDITFGAPAKMKILYTSQDVTADLGEEGQLVMDWSSEVGEWQTLLNSKGVGVKDYRVRPPTRGKRISLTISEYTDQPVRINALTLNAKIGKARPW